MAWYGRTLKSNIYAFVNKKVLEKFSDTYPSINCGTEYLRKTTPAFPYVRFYKSDDRQMGQTFDGGVSAVDQTYTIDVFSNDHESTCETIAEYIAEILSGNMRIIQNPIPTYSDVSEYRYTLKVAWVIGASNVVTW
jgi:hypothetical protein